MPPVTRLVPVEEDAVTGQSVIPCMYGDYIYRAKILLRLI